MRPKYPTQAIVLARAPIAESSTRLALLTPELGLVHARAQGLRKGGAKLASALQTLSEADVTLVRGKDAWRLSGAVLAENWFQRLSPSARGSAGRIAGLISRLVHGESADPACYRIFRSFLSALTMVPESAHDAAETLAALRILHALGLDAGEVPGADESYDADTLAQATAMRRDLISRVNRGISASGL